MRSYLIYVIQKENAQTKQFSGCYCSEKGLATSRLKNSTSFPKREGTNEYIQECIKPLHCSSQHRGALLLAALKKQPLLKPCGDHNSIERIPYKTASKGRAHGPNFHPKPAVIGPHPSQLVFRSATDAGGRETRGKRERVIVNAKYANLAESNRGGEEKKSQITICSMKKYVTNKNKVDNHLKRGGQSRWPCT